MDMYESLYSSSSALNEQIARQLFEILPEQGPVVVLVDRQGHLWPSNSERFSQFNVAESLLKEVCAKIDDGAEPVVTQVADSSVVAAELATDHTKCGYVVIILQQYGPESTLANIDLVEMLLSQINLIAKLIEKNSRLYELQMTQWSVYGQVEAPIN